MDFYTKNVVSFSKARMLFYSGFFMKWGDLGVFEQISISFGGLISDFGRTVRGS